MIEITKMLTLSTAHLSKKIIEIFDDDALLETEYPDAIVYPKGEYGYFVIITAELVESAKLNADDTFNKIVLMAASLGCQTICFDRDAETLVWLKTFDW